MKLVILAAGVGSRLGFNLPKAMVEIEPAKTILDFQLDNFFGVIDPKDIIIVVGYKKETIMERYPQLQYLYNPDYSITNTSKSLLIALNQIKDEDVIFINGDIFFTKQIAYKISQCKETTFLVNTEPTADEEIKYRLNEYGKICELSKEVKAPMGESVGVNFISASDVEIVKRELETVQNMDYFEKAFENLVLKSKLEISPVYVNGEFVREIDFLEDLQVVRDYLKENK
ncbi:NTP transferase domain-containing protein [Paenibacillus phoenicis]|uniref:NTP transferase domain-containing protein n=1 Tax=Paenibacillus phoenicis TaxID=554117 RepID=A0ABU5PMY4_9BACL|nr:NTP transferase domain-containing protein [Paenibacillus phoenicis]MEA3571285.1 NTP transferase domain-containing protein [Paenibacillus phoenicis]